jgi:hypothetical protein
LRIRLLGGVVIVGVALLAAAVIAWGGEVLGASGHATPPLIASGQSASASALSDTFAVLGSPRTASDDLDQSVANSGSPMVQAGADPAQARLARTLQGWGVWLVPGADVICLYAGHTTGGGGGSACPYAKTATDGLLLTVGAGADELLLAGAVPNGVQTVDVHYGDGRTEQLEVQNNAYVALVSSDAKNVTYQDANGPQERLVPSCGPGC